MSTPDDFEKIAVCLADLAVGQTPEAAAPVASFVKSAFQITPEVERYLLNGLLGAGVGVGLGSLQPEKKTRNILYYGALGGLGGLGLSKLTEKNVPAPAPVASPELSRGRQQQLTKILQAKVTDQDKYRQLLGMADAVK
jgi:hypothetical protein